MVKEYVCDCSNTVFGKEIKRISLNYYKCIYCIKKTGSEERAGHL